MGNSGTDGMFPGILAELGSKGEAVLLGIEWSGEKLAHVRLSPHYFPNFHQNPRSSGA
jgi:hypothetical protein